MALSAVLQGGAPPAPHAVRWYEAAAAAAGATALMVFDESVQRYVQDHRSATTDDVASVFRHGGQPEVFGTLSVGLMAVGLVDHRSGVTRAGARLAASVALAELWTLTMKTVAGRSRPVAGVGAFDFDPFSGAESFPSGHTTVAFALATDLADELDRGWIRVGLYTLASGTAWSRLNDDRHWFSDVGWGALVGVTSTKLVNGRWRVFGIAPPRLLLGPDGRAAMGWRWVPRHRGMR